MVKTRGTMGVLLAMFMVIGNGSWLAPTINAQYPDLGDMQNTRTVPASAAAASAIVDDAVILLDVTGSMRGEGPDPRARDIWDKTVHAVSDIVDRLAPQTNLALVPFSNGPDWKKIFPGPLAAGASLIPRQTASGEDRQAFKDYLSKLVADGEATWLYESWDYSLAQLRQWREADPTRTHRQALFLYTDGIDNGPNGQLGIEGIVKLIRAQTADYRGLYLVYNDLAGQLNSEQKAQLAEAGVTVTVGPPTSNVELVTEKLDFGRLPVNTSGTGQAILFRSGFADVWGKQVRLRIEDAGSKLPVAMVAETVQLGEQVTVALRPTGLLPDGQYAARLIVEPVDGAFNLIPRNSVDLVFSFASPPPEPPPASAPAVAPIPRRSIVEGVPDLLLLLGALIPLAGGSVSFVWWRQLWLFKWPGRAAQLTWRRDEVAADPEEEATRTRTIRPERSRWSEEWLIGVEGYVSIPDGGSAIMPNHARIVYGGRKQRSFRLVPVEGEVRAGGRPVGSDGTPLVYGSTFEIGPYHFRFDSLDD